MRKPIQHFSVALCFILALCPLAGASSDCDLRYSNYARAVQLHDMGDYDAALRHYQCALEEDPDNAVIPLLIANVHEDIENAGKAWSSGASPTTAEILELPPVSTWGERSLSRRQQDFADLTLVESVNSESSPSLTKLAVARLSVRIEPNGHSLWLFYRSDNRGVALVLGKNQAPADELIKRARMFARNLDWTRARVSFEQALALDPNRFDIRCELGMALREIGAERAALQQFDIVLARDPVDACAGPNRDALMQAMRDG